jgi:hypothetical protein
MVSAHRSTEMGETPKIRKASWPGETHTPWKSSQTNGQEPPDPAIETKTME